MNSLSGRAEWARTPMLPIAALFGYSVSVIHIYGINPYIVPVTTEFGWSREQFTWAFSLAILFQAAMAIPLGILVDKFGSRKLGQVGIVLTCLAFAGLSTATADLSKWYLLWAVITVAALAVQATVWTSAVASRFTAARGLALAFTLCGASIAQFAMPPLATTLIGDYGWRTAFWMHGLIWLALVLPFVFFWFRGAHDVPVKAVEPPPARTGMDFRDGLRSATYLRLLLASLFFTFTVVALNFQFMPLLNDWGIPADTAKWYASLIGLASIAGRLGIGWLIDRFDAAKIGGTVFLLPVASALLLLFGREFGATPAVVAILLGFTLGAEVDVIVYLTTRFFGLKNFGALYGGLLAALSVGTALGPLAAARVFDRTGSYDNFFWIALGLAVLASLALFTLPKPPPLETPAHV